MTKKFNDVYIILKGVDNEVIKKKAITNIGYKQIMNGWGYNHFNEEITYTVEVTNMNKDMLRTVYVVRNSRVNDANYELSIRCYKVNMYGRNKLLGSALYKDSTLDELKKILEN